MQFSSNSNAAIVALIRACPTYAGQYRQAVLQMRDRQQALANYRFSVRKRELEIKIKQASIQHLTQDAAKHQGTEREQLETQIELLEIEIEESQFAIAQESELVGDAIREVQVCCCEIERIHAESGINFGHCSDEQFQALMTREYTAKQQRWFTANALAPRLGLPVGAVEQLLCLPADQQQMVLEEIQGTLSRLSLEGSSHESIT